MILYNQLILNKKNSKERITANLAQAACHLVSDYFSKPNTQGYPQEQWITQQTLLGMGGCRVILFCGFLQ
ncbi:hypothetical protein XCR1_1550017 [Xenorhabdus cabanillasii JM26]|uniref:Uncharacterized protein n=1 Tax=Xenorhabdus cabanillasii JM26 TaxID=1427517 RepID=W1IPU2_9GAMM|nr:hypothetical protein XCR1_1550017 [Xenorhabdus cabanillasii JM26]